MSLLAAAENPFERDLIKALSTQWFVFTAY